MYLTIVIVFSILTGIITTIIEKKGYHVGTQKSVVQSVNIPSRVVRSKKAQQSVLIPVIQPDENFAKTTDILSISQEIGVLEPETIQNDTFYKEPVMMGIIDEEIL